MAERIAGVDEVGRGPWAGPVITAAVILKKPLSGLKDSKKLSASQREMLVPRIQESACVALGAASVAEIDRLNILKATLLAMRRAVLGLKQKPDLVLVDGNHMPDLPIPAKAVIKGDDLHPEISAASIIAKVCRDRLMCVLAKRYPAYDWHNNKGYGTKNHQQGLLEHGPVAHHRLSFKPVRERISL